MLRSRSRINVTDFIDKRPQPAAAMLHPAAVLPATLQHPYHTVSAISLSPYDHEEDVSDDWSLVGSMV